jgi:uncharacterized repeat protein (TIGR03806 family)
MQTANSPLRRFSAALFCVGAWFAGSFGIAPAAENASPATKPIVRAVGIEKRVPWTTSRVIGSPDPPFPYDTERAFPALKFEHPVDITSAPGLDRLFVVEQAGKIYSFPNRPDAKSADLAIDVAHELPGVKETYAITFHPKFADNRFCYICSIREPDRKDGTRVSRFRVTKTDPPKIDPKSEQVVITWLSGGHNGCCLKFGPEGCLYISTGDGAGPNPPDTKRTGQDISDLLSSILRIDVDHPEAGRNYRIPADNPFVNTPGARPEVWAYGLRNPWRMSFDQKTGDLWVGDVGWELWEMLYRVERGGNYGWSVMEGRQPTNPEWPRGPTPILPPVVDHPHSESSSITGGATYYGSRLPELVGVYLYGDYDTGKIWGLRWQGGKIAWHRELADTTLRIVGFGEDPSGELYLLDHVGGTVQRLIPNPEKSQASRFPRRLSETGLFASVADQRPAVGVLRYSINAEPWEDGAVAERFVGVPGDSQINTAAAPWQFPKNAVLAKTLSLASDSQREGRRRVETQLLHYTGIDWRAYAYRWNAEQTDAVLLDANGEDGLIEAVASAMPGDSSKRTWHFASRAECLRCHNPWSGSALAFQPAQLSKTGDYGGVAASQLDTFFHLGVCAPPVPADKRPKMANPRDVSADLSQRARAYLHVNCAHCHRVNAGSAVLSQMVYDLPLDQTAMIDARPTQGGFGILGARVIAAGDPCRSVLLYRMSKIGNGRMPHLGSQRVDPDGVRLISEWIAGMRPQEKPSRELETATRLRRQEERLLKQLRTGQQQAEAARTLTEQLLSTTSGALALLLAAQDGDLSKGTLDFAVAKATTVTDISVRDLFERFLPEDKRVKRLGSVIRPADILRLSADAKRGKHVFFETAGVQCKNCHRIEGTGRAVGPDLDHIGKKLSAAQLLESILEPSKRIDPQFVTYLAETDDGRLVNGILVSKGANEVVLKDAQGALVHIPAKKIERLVGQSRSLMPELQLRDLTAKEVADLLAFLSALR